MKRFWFGYKKKDAEKIRSRNEKLEKLRQLLSVGGHEAETEFVELLKQWKPDISGVELQEQIRRYHDAVSDRQSRDRESR